MENNLPKRNVFLEDTLFSAIGIEFMKFMKELVAKEEYIYIRDFLFEPKGNAVTNCVEQSDEVANLSEQKASKRKPAKALVADDKINKIKQYVETHYGRSISVSEVAGIAGLSNDAFSRFFKKNMGVCFTGYVNEIRIKKAARLLCETEDTVVEIGYITGFNTPCHFNEVFKQSQGITPGEYRKLHNGIKGSLQWD